VITPASGVQHLLIIGSTQVRPKACWRKSSSFKSAVGRLESEDETRTDEQERERLAKARLVKRIVKFPSHPGPEKTGATMSTQ
jgi:hypothetical protein